MDGFQPHSMDWTWTIFWLATQPICHSMLTMESIWNTYGMVPSICNPWTGPCGFHGISNEFELQSMYYSIWIPWKQIPWINPLNGLSKIVSALEIKHSTLSTHHVVKSENVLTAGLFYCYKILNFPQLVVLWTGHAQSKHWQMLMLDFGRHQQSTMLFLNHHHHPQTPPPPNTDDTVSSDSDNTQRCHHAQ